MRDHALRDELNMISSDHHRPWLHPNDAAASSLRRDQVLATEKRQKICSVVEFLARVPLVEVDSSA